LVDSLETNEQVRSLAPNLEASVEELKETPMELSRLDLFAYGTLKRGQRNHERFCQSVKQTQAATLRGHLYNLPLGFPALVVPHEDVIATGTTDYLTDAEKQHCTPPGPATSLPGWDTVHGELLSFDDPRERLPALDGLEGFYPGAESFYSRVLVPATLTENGASVLAWAYTVESGSGVYLPDARWPPP